MRRILENLVLPPIQKKIIFMIYKIKAKQLASKFRNENDAVNYLESRNIFLREFVATEKEKSINAQIQRFGETLLCMRNYKSKKYS